MGNFGYGWCCGWFGVAVPAQDYEAVRLILARLEACSLVLQVAWGLTIALAIALTMCPAFKLYGFGSAPGYTFSDGQTIVASR